MKHIIGLLAMLLPLFSGAQSPSQSPLNIGDSVPDVVLNNVTNYPKSTAKLSDFKGDLVLLDYWGTWCSSCIRGFPKMDSLKKEYKNLQVLLINNKTKLTHDNESTIQKVLKTLDKRTGSSISLPVVYNNDELDRLFPVLYVPQVVWIRKNRVIAVTGSAEVTAESISAALAGKPLSVHIKKDLFAYHSSVPLFIKGNGGDGQQMLYRSMVTNYVEGIGYAKGNRVDNGKFTGCYLLNYTLLSLVSNAYPDIMIHQYNRICFESNNRDLMVKGEPPIYQHRFCYELTIPPSTEKQMKQYMQEDIKKYFRLSVHNEVRPMKCLILQPSAAYDPTSVSKDKKGDDLQKDTRRKYIHNQSIVFALSVLNEYTPVPIIDECHLETNISIDLPFDLTDIKALQKAFNEAGFSLKEGVRELEVTVISDL